MPGVKIILGVEGTPDVMDITNRVIQTSLQIESIIGQTVDHCEFTVYDPNRDLIIPDLIDITVSRIDTGEKLFAGIVAYVVGTVEGPFRTWQVNCQDYTVLLDRTLVLQNYVADYTHTDPDGTIYHGDKGIITSAFERDALGPFGLRQKSEIDVRGGTNTNPFVQEGLRSLSQQQFRYNTLREVLSQLSNYIGFDYYVDYDKKLHYFYREDRQARYFLTDEPNVRWRSGQRALGYQKINWKRDGTRLVNTFALFGDRLFADAQTSILSSDGIQSSYDLGHENIGLNYPILPVRNERTIQVDFNRGSGNAKIIFAHSSRSSHDTVSNNSINFLDIGIIEGDIVINLSTKTWGVVREVNSRRLIIDGLRQTGRDMVQTVGRRFRETQHQFNFGNLIMIPNWNAQPVSNSSGLSSTPTGTIVHDTIGRVISFPSNRIPPINNFAVRLRYTHNFVGGHIDSDPYSLQLYGDLGNGNYRVLSRRVIASEVNTAQGILYKMEHLKEQYSYPLEVITVTVDDGALRDANIIRLVKGEWVHLINTVLDIGTDLRDLGRQERDYLIHRITTRVVGGQGGNQSYGVDSITGDRNTGNEDTNFVSNLFLEYELELRNWEVDLA